MDDYIGPCVFDFCIQKCDAVHRGGRIKEMEEIDKKFRNIKEEYN